MLQILHLPESCINLCAWRLCSVLILICCCLCCWVNDLCAWELTLISLIILINPGLKLHLKLLRYSEDAVQCTYKHCPLHKKKRKTFLYSFSSHFLLGNRGTTKIMCWVQIEIHPSGPKFFALQMRLMDFIFFFILSPQLQRLNFQEQR